jgi:hypothetical protein
VGQEIEEGSFTPDDAPRFSVRCRECLAALDEMLAEPGFGAGPPSVGVECEIGLVDGRAQPAPVNTEVHAAAADPHLATELDRFNLELDTDPAPVAGRPFTALAEGLGAGLARVAAAAEPLGARPIAVGILPTLRAEHLGRAAMTDSPRYRALNDGLRRLRGGPFEIHIDGAEPIDTTWDDVTLEGAATGLHAHLRVPSDRFAATLNAAQIATAPALAAATNSPLLLERVLWHETRVALFGQAVDDRATVTGAWLPSRAAFGHGWVAAPADPFAESVALHAPILPVVSGEDPLAELHAGRSPSLYELRLHHGTVWRWNRAVIATGDDPHLRIEIRALPAGPTVADMLANVAFVIGLTLALAPQMGWMARSMPFDFARRNFYAAARQGLESVLLWPSPEAPSPRPAPAADLVRRLLPVARDGLVTAGVEGAEADAWLAVIGERVARGTTGSVWQRRALAALERTQGRSAALAAMTELYLAGSASGAPVHAWAAPG